LFSFIGPSIVLNTFLWNAFKADSDFLARVQLSLAYYRTVLYSRIFVWRCTAPDLMMDSSEKYTLFACPILLWISFSSPAFVLWFDHRYTKSVTLYNISPIEGRVFSTRFYLWAKTAVLSQDIPKLQCIGTMKLE
jgi:hypothetical protein